MRIALFNIDSVASNASTRSFIEAHKDQVVFVGLSPPFRGGRGGALEQSRKYLTEHGFLFSMLLWFNFVLPRLVGLLLPLSPTVTGLCRRHGIRVEAVSDVNSPELRRTLEGLKVDLIVSSFFDQIFRPEIIALPKHGVVNVHISPLPYHRGAMPVVHGCLADPPRLGVTIHAVDAGIDTGPILAREPLAGAPSRSVLTMMGRLQAQGMELLSKLLPSIESGRVAGIAQAGGNYDKFPDRAVIARLRRRGFALFGLRDILRSLFTPMKT